MGEFTCKLPTCLSINYEVINYEFLIDSKVIKFNVSSTLVTPIFSLGNYTLKLTYLEKIFSSLKDWRIKIPMPNHIYKVMCVCFYFTWIFGTTNPKKLSVSSEFLNLRLTWVTTRAIQASALVVEDWDTGESAVIQPPWNL